MRLIINYYIVYKAILDLLLEHKKFRSYNTFYFKYWSGVGLDKLFIFSYLLFYSPIPKMSWRLLMPTGILVC